MTAPRIEIQNTGPQKPWLGQLVPLEVSVWRPEAETPLEPFSLDDVVASGAIAKWAEHVSPPDERQEGDTHFLVQHRTLLVFPQTDGRVVIPPIVARYTDAASEAPVAVVSKSFAFQAAIPAGAGQTLPLVATSVKLTQLFDRDLSTLKVGDGFTRTLTLTATDTDTIVFPGLTLAAVAGMTEYSAGKHAESSTERGKNVATEAQAITYVVDRVGPHRMPGLSLRWLEPRSGRYYEATVEDTTLWAAPNPALGFSCLGTARGTALGTAVVLLGGLAIVTLLILRRLRRGPGRWERAFVRRSEERRAFHAVLRAARVGAAHQLLTTLYAWLTIRSPRKLDRTLNAFRHATAEASDLADSLDSAVFSTSASLSIDTGKSRAILRSARSAMRRSGRRPGLAPLNPSVPGQGEPL